MRHYRIVALLVALGAALSIPAVGSTAPGDQVKGPGCGDITLWNSDQTDNPQYTTHLAGGGTGPATVYASITTAKPSCTNFTYTVTVYSDATQQTVLDSQTVSGDGSSGPFQYTYTPTGTAPAQVCIAATSMRDGHVVDAAPDSGCFVLVLDGGSGGASGLN